MKIAGKCVVLKTIILSATADPERQMLCFLSLTEVGTESSDICGFEIFIEVIN